MDSYPKHSVNKRPLQIAYFIWWTKLFSVSIQNKVQEKIFEGLQFKFLNNLQQMGVLQIVFVSFV